MRVAAAVLMTLSGTVRGVLRPEFFGLPEEELKPLRLWAGISSREAKYNISEEGVVQAKHAIRIDDTYAELLEEISMLPGHVDIFGRPEPYKTRHGFFEEHDGVDWAVLAASAVMCIVFDFTVLQRHFTPGVHCSIIVLCFWISIGLLFNCYIGLRHGFDDALHWFNGYVLEWLLSMDNLFVFHLVFRLYRTPEKLLHKALFWGIFGAISFRMLFFIALNSLLHVLHWFHYVFGVLLIISGIQAAREDDDDEQDLESSMVVKSLKWMFQERLTDYDMEGRLVVWPKADPTSIRAPRMQLTMLVPVILCLEVTDILFAIDSCSAKVAQIPDQFLAYSSSVFAMFGLRALFFIVNDLVNRLHLLKYGLCFILVFIGAELLIADYVKLPASTVCAVLVSVFFLCIVLSTVFPSQPVQADRC